MLMDLLLFPRWLLSQDPLMTFLGSIIVSFGVFRAGALLVSTLLFSLGDFTNPRLLHEPEAQPSLKSHLILSKFLLRNPFLLILLS